MKPEPQAVTNHNFQNVRDVEGHAKTRMDKVLTDFQHEMAGFRKSVDAVHGLMAAARAIAPDLG